MCGIAGMFLKKGPVKEELLKGIHRLLQLAFWHRIFIEGDGEEPPRSIHPAEFLG
jgi:hypothetical protein